MIYPEIITTYLPCNEEYKPPKNIDEVPNHKYYRKDSDGTEIFISPTGRQVYIKTKKEDIFPLEAPIQVDFEITQKCNLKCKHCYVLERKEFFSQKTWKVIEKIIDAGVLAIELCGGEPLVVNEIFDVIKYIKSKNRWVMLSTNGTLINKEIARKLAENTPDTIYVSLDGPKEIHDEIRGSGNFEKACQGIKNLNDEGVFPLVSFTINKMNLKHLPKMVEEIKQRSLEIPKLFLILMEPSNADKDFTKNCFKHSERSYVEKIIKGMDIKSPEQVMHFAPKKINALYYGCFFRLTMCQLTPEGNVLPCPILSDEIVGNILEEDFKDIWKRMYHQTANKRKDKCTKCKYNKRCFPCVFDEY